MSTPFDQLATSVLTKTALEWLGSTRVTLVAGVSITIKDAIDGGVGEDLSTDLKVLTIKPATNVDVHINKSGAATANHSQVSASGEGNRPCSYTQAQTACLFSVAGGAVDIDQYGTPARS